MALLLDGLYLLGLLLASPWLLWRAWRTGRYRRGLRTKLFGLAAPPGPPGAVWFHGVSVGEVHLLRQVVAAFRRRFPHLPVVISSTTDTGLDEAKRCFADMPVFVFPFDFSWAVRRTIRQVRPTLIVLAEGELWPNFLFAARSLAVPVAIINGRMSPRSLARYRRLGPLPRMLFEAIDLFAAQSEGYAAAVRRLGARPERVAVTGSVKYDGAVSDRDNPRTRSLRRLFGLEDGSLVWVAGSTQTPEEEIILDVFERLRTERSDLRLILVPRQKDAFDAVADLLRRRGVPFVRRSSLTAPPEGRPVVLVDTFGELSAVWGLADVAFVGGSLDGRRGGQNMIEPAALGAAVLFGPHVWNFREIAARLVEVGAAVEVADAAGLETTVRRLLDDADLRRTMGQAGRAFVAGQQGATERTVALLGERLSRQDGRQPPVRECAA